MGLLKTFVVPHAALDSISAHPKEFVSSIQHERIRPHTQFHGHAVTFMPYLHAVDEHAIVWFNESVYLLSRADDKMSESEERNGLYVPKKDIRSVGEFVGSELRFLKDFSSGKIDYVAESACASTEPFESMSSFITVYGDHIDDLEKYPSHFAQSLSQAMHSNYSSSQRKVRCIAGQSMVQMPVGKNPALYVHAGGEFTHLGHRSVEMNSLKSEHRHFLSRLIGIVEKEHYQLGI